MENRLIFDLGMHKGEDTEYYLQKGFSVVAVEADPELADSGIRRFARQISSGQLVVLNKAIARLDSPITFYRCENITDWGTIDKNWAQRNQALGGDISEITVDGITFPRLLEIYGIPYYMKIDIEGADILCLKGLFKTNQRPKYISIESSKLSFDELFGEFCLFVQLGYTRFKIIPQHKIGQQKLPNPPLEGIYVNQSFKRGSSGSFGLELPGQWLSLEAALKRYLRVFQVYRFTGDAGTLSSVRLIRRTLNTSRGKGSLVGSFIRGIAKPIAAKLGLRPGWYDTHAMYTGPE